MGPVAAGFLLSRAARARRAPTPRLRCLNAMKATETPASGGRSTLT
jgi:hypothetical protein